jgi:hypothetical protein
VADNIPRCPERECRYEQTKCGSHWYCTRCSEGGCPQCNLDSASTRQESKKRTAQPEALEKKLEFIQRDFDQAGTTGTTTRQESQEATKACALPDAHQTLVRASERINDARPSEDIYIYRTLVITLRKQRRKEQKERGEIVELPSFEGKFSQLERPKKGGPWLIFTDEAVVVSESRIYDIPASYKDEGGKKQISYKGQAYDRQELIITEGVADCMAVAFRRKIEGHDYFYFGHWSTRSYNPTYHMMLTGEGSDKAPRPTQAMILFEWFKALEGGPLRPIAGATANTTHSNFYSDDVPKTKLYCNCEESKIPTIDVAYRSGELRGSLAGNPDWTRCDPVQTAKGFALVFNGSSAAGPKVDKAKFKKGDWVKVTLKIGPYKGLSGKVKHVNDGVVTVKLFRPLSISEGTTFKLITATFHNPDSSLKKLF